jgi:hypothetical protein
MVNWLTALIALIVAFISALQWITARQKVVLDLFDKRFATYEGLCDAVSPQGGKPPTVENILKFTLAVNRAQFLFGPEVMIFLEERKLDLSFLVVTDHGNDTQRQRVQDEYISRLNSMTRFFRDLDVLVAPYMKHTQKRFSIPYIDT